MKTHLLTNKEKDRLRRGLSMLEVVYKTADPDDQSADIGFALHDCLILKGFLNPKYTLKLEIHDADFRLFTYDNNVDFPVYTEEELQQQGVENGVKACENCEEDIAPEGQFEFMGFHYCEMCINFVKGQLLRHELDIEEDCGDMNWNILMDAVQRLERMFNRPNKFGGGGHKQEFMDQFAHVYLVNNHLFVSGTLEAVYDNVLDILIQYKEL